MTCIIGWIDKDKNVWMASDGRASDGNSKITLKNKKVFKHFDFLIGHTGEEMTFGQIIESQFEPSSRGENVSDTEYLFDTFLVELKTCFIEKGVDVSKNVHDPDKLGKLVGELLVGYRGHLIRVELFGGILEITRPYDAVGCGADIALGYLYSISRQREIVPEDLRDAVAACNEFMVGVGPPYHLQKLEYNNDGCCCE